MSTPLQDVIDIIDTFKSDDVTIPEANAIKFAKAGVVAGSIELDVDYTISSKDEDVPDGNGGTITTKVFYIDEELSDKELSTKVVYLCGLYAYRAYAMKEHETYAKKAVNFKTINFAVTGLTERSKELLRIITQLNKMIDDTLVALGKPAGSSTLMTGDDT